MSSPESKFKKITRLESQMVRALDILHQEAEVSVCIESDSSADVGDAGTHRYSSFRSSQRFSDTVTVVDFYMDRIIKITEE